MNKAIQYLESATKITEHSHQWHLWRLNKLRRAARALQTNEKPSNHAALSSPSRCLQYQPGPTKYIINKQGKKREKGPAASSHKDPPNAYNTRTNALERSVVKTTYETTCGGETSG